MPRAWSPRWSPPGSCLSRASPQGKRVSRGQSRCPPRSSFFALHNLCADHASHRRHGRFYRRLALCRKSPLALSRWLSLLIVLSSFSSGISHLRQQFSRSNRTNLPLLLVVRRRGRCRCFPWFTLQTMASVHGTLGGKGESRPRSGHLCYWQHVSYLLVSRSSLVSPIPSSTQPTGRRPRFFFAFVSAASPPPQPNLTQHMFVPFVPSSPRLVHGVPRVVLFELLLRTCCSVIDCHFAESVFRRTVRRLSLVHRALLFCPALHRLLLIALVSTTGAVHHRSIRAVLLLGIGQRHRAKWYSLEVRRTGQRPLPALKLLRSLCLSLPSPLPPF
jgi:hypothetical protein